MSESENLEIDTRIAQKGGGEAQRGAGRPQRRDGGGGGMLLQSSTAWESFAKDS